MPRRLIDEAETEPISPLIDVVANAMAAMFVMLVIYMALTARPEPPPIITISEADGLRFESGRADLTPEAEERLRESLAPTIQKEAARCRCDVVEVIGHTDGQALRTASNLDRLMDVRVDSTGSLVPGSNTDLGLLRAWSVISRLRSLPSFSGIRFYGYSAGQTVLPSGQLAGGENVAEADRRRIEIRLRRTMAADAQR